ncbi:MAG: hypothetical protein KKG00_03355 [Bacteroidetes bacterium]|nr:hypothetical protein [Bacteroidota bacterium]
MKTLLISSLLLYLLFACGDQSATHIPRQGRVSCSTAEENHVVSNMHEGDSRHILVAVWLGNNVMLRIVSFEENILHFDPNQNAARVRLPKVVKVQALNEYPGVGEE